MNCKVNLLLITRLSSVRRSLRTMFKPKRVLILTKMTRFEFEQMRYTDREVMERELERRGSDYHRLEEKHQRHQKYLNTIVDELNERSIETQVVQRLNYTTDKIEWADAILTAGGDGTFLLAASKIMDRSKPVIGINTDPISSEGYMCLMKKLPVEHFSSALDRLMNGDFEWLWRQRIRVELSGSRQAAVELHEQQLRCPEHRWSEHVREQEEAAVERSDGDNNGSQHVRPGVSTVLPFLALNEVFIGESISSRVSYYEMAIDDQSFIKQKSSGLTVCTGTGSTSWHFNINKMTDQTVTELCDLISQESGQPSLPQNASPDLISRVCRRFNDQLLFHPSDLRMAFTVRDPVFSATYPAFTPRGFVERCAVVRSRCWDAHLVIDGGMSYSFNDGARAILRICPEDALKTVVFRDSS